MSPAIPAGANRLSPEGLQTRTANTRSNPSAPGAKTGRRPCRDASQKRMYGPKATRRLLCAPPLK